LKKAFANIVNNGIKYSPEEQVLTVTINNGKLMIENTGVTIEENQLNEIFKPFYRVDKSRNKKTGGSGLGLYIVKTILDKHENISYKMESTKNSVRFIIEFRSV
jgi:two-component system sensor histidine kinase VanS